jgi:hypothetical protein
MWARVIDSSELTADLLAAMKKDGLTIQDGHPSAHLTTVTTDNLWMANKWEMSEQAGHQPPPETLLDQLAKMGALTFILLFVLSVLGVAWVLWYRR